MAPKKGNKKKPDSAANLQINTTDYAQIQNDEFQVIQAIYADDFQEIQNKPVWGSTSNSKAFQLRLKSLSDPDIWALITVEFTATYPKTAPILTLKDSHGLRDKSKQAVGNVLINVPKLNLGREMIHDITSAIDEILSDEAEYRAHGETLPALDEERAKNEAIASKLAQAEELKRIETKEREKAEEEQAMQVLVNQELHRRNEDARRKNKTSSVEHLPLPDAYDPETVTFERKVTISQNGSKYSFNSVGGLTNLSQGLVTEVYSAYPRITASNDGFQVAPMLLVIKKCTISQSSAHEKKKILALEKELEALKQVPPHSNCMKLLDFRIDSLHSGWELNILIEYANRGSLADYIIMLGSLPTALLRSWTTDLLDALHFYHTHSVIHGKIRPNNVLLFQSPGGTMTIKLSDAEFQKTLYEIKGKPTVPSAWTVNWKAPEIAGEHAQKWARKTDIWDLGMVFLQMIFQLDVPERHKGPSDILALNLSSALKTIISEFFKRDPAKRPNAWDLKPSEFLRNEHPIYDDDSSEMERSTLLLSPHNSIGSRRHRHSNISYPPVGLQVSRYKTDWEEICRLGKGGYGEVVKARNRMDLAAYAIKKIRQPESLLSKVIPEIMMLSRVNHPNVVRYYTAWMETDSTDAIDSSTGSDQYDNSDDETDQDFRSGITPGMSQGLDFVSSSGLPNFVFAPDTDDETETRESSGEEMDDSEGNETEDDEKSASGEISKPTQPKLTRFASPSTQNRYAILYIQMEFCERQTLRDLIIKGLDKNMDEVWRLFRKIVTGLKHIHEVGIIHRDLKPENIFIDTANSPKIGDFGLATSGVHAVVLKANSNTLDADMTKDIGTASYVAPEVLSDATGSYSEKVDMYSLGIILFEMCYPTKTSMERAEVVANIRKKDCILPDALQTPGTAKQKDIIKALLNHRPADRPSAKELLKGGKIPFEIEDDQIQEILQGLVKPDSPYNPLMMDVLFSKNQLSEIKATVWDAPPESDKVKTEINGDRLKTGAQSYEVLLLGHLKAKLTDIFRQHGATELDRPFIFPKSDLYENKNIVQLLNHSGTQLQLPYDLTLPMARSIARVAPVSQRSYSFGRVFRESSSGGMPRSVTEVDFDIVSRDALDVALKEAEVIKVLDQLLDTLPNFSSTQTYFHVNHCDLLDLILESCRVEPGLRPQAKEVISKLNTRGVTWSAVRNELRNANIGIAATSLDDLAKFDFRDSPEKVFNRLKKLLSDSQHRDQLQVITKSIKAALNYTKEFGVKRKIYICPLSCFHSEFYESGIMFQLLIDIKQHKDVIAAGGRYDRLIQLLKPKGNQALFNSCHAVGFSLGFDNLVRLIVQLQMKSKSGFLKKVANQGKNAPPKQIPVRRCDILVASFDSRILRSAGLNILSHLWANGLTAELAGDANDLDDLVQRNIDEKHSWVVLVKSDSVLSKSELSVVSLPSKHSVDVTVENLITHLYSEIRERDDQEAQFTGSTAVPFSKQDRSTRLLFPHRPAGNTTLASSSSNSNNNTGDASASSTPDVHFLVGQHKGKKINRSTAIELAATNISDLLASVRDTAPVAAVETSDAALEAIRTARLSDSEEWRRVIQAAPAGDRSYLHQLHGMLEGFRGEWQQDSGKSRMAFVFNFRTGWICLYDLGL
jgi:eukaryotic translation initiation factor 2-alpha kinase 4